MKKDNRAAYVEIAPAVPIAPTQAQTYTYRAPAGQPAPSVGALVTIPFGRRQVQGTVLAAHRRTPAYAVRPLVQASGSLLTAGQIAFGRALAAAAHGGVGFTLRLFKPPAPIVPLQRRRRPPSLPAPPPAIILEADAAARRRAVMAAAKTSGRQAQTLVLLPEIWMAEAWQAAGARILHTDLPAKEQAAVWQAVGGNEPGVVAGTQKACYLPWQNLRLIVVEEEQLPTHKLWDQYPRLDNRFAARTLAGLHGARRLLAGSYPSLAVRRLIAEESATVIRGNPLALKTSYLAYAPADRQQRRLLPDELRRRIADWRHLGESILLFISRRAARRRIYAELPPSAAAAVTIGSSALFAAHPGARYDRIVWLQPEQALFFPDFRSYEHARITLARLHGLRTDHRRAVVLATRHLETVQQALGGADDAWGAAQLAERRLLRLPPYTDLVRLTIAAASPVLAMKKGVRLRRELEEKVQKGPQPDVAIFGPYASRAAPPSPDCHLLLQGPLDALVPLYAGSRGIAVADVMPEQIL